MHNLFMGPTPPNPGIQSAANLACMAGYDCLAAYLSEKFPVDWPNYMSLDGNISSRHDWSLISENLTTRNDLILKETLAVTWFGDDQGEYSSYG
jgi:hypothetical protein